MSMNYTLIDRSYDILKQSARGMSFKDLYAAVSQAAGIPEELKKRKKAQLYATIMEDPRFVSENGVWDLKERHSFRDVLEELEAEDDEGAYDEENSLEDADVIEEEKKDRGEPGTADATEGEE